MYPNVADYIAKRLNEQGVHVLFGVPGVTCDAMFEAAPRNGIMPVVNSSDLEAGYAADGYARVRGLGAVSVSYGVGTLSLINAIAGGYVERSPIVAINGGPSQINLWNEQRYDVLFSHSIGRDETDLKLFAQVTALAVRINQVSEVPTLVDRAITVAIKRKRPVYIEVAKDIWYEDCAPPLTPLDVTLLPVGNEDEIANIILAELEAAVSPALLLGIEVQRYGVADQVASLVEQLRIPWATTLLAKSVLPEDYPGFIGVYAGTRSSRSVRNAIENADLLVALGCTLSLGLGAAVKATFHKMVHISNGLVRIRDSAPARTDFVTLVSALNSYSSHIKIPPDRTAQFSSPSTSRSLVSTASKRSVDGGLTHDALFQAIGEFLDESFVVVADIYLSLYPAAELRVIGRDAFVCNSVWASIGHSTAASVGVGLAEERRPLVICGDGGFQMTAQSLSTLARHALKAIVIVIDNGMYGIEQYLIDRKYFDDATRDPLPRLVLNRWDYSALARAMGFRFAETVDTCEEFVEALARARDCDGPAFITAVLTPRDLPSQLK